MENLEGGLEAGNFGDQFAGQFSREDEYFEGSSSPQVCSARPLIGNLAYLSMVTY